ncbi:LiaF transmembrane domain-containing protein [Companilactobacillus mishanensis]|uniref:LiaF transmembrane domain-containing protein n=1 Tax=Companilactobacillus mishanensis TaxID=2486008 RepID=UPI001296DCAE|nr:hypothetical protein [Companilactobacillus mishanensis]MQS89704.1 hypothetical protein [Companilactobacillus mishanensis]
MRNRNGVFWGLFLLVGAGVLVASQMHLFSISVGIFSIILTIILVGVLIKSLVYYAVPGAVFSLAFLAIIYAGPLHITYLVPWTILGAALLISIGLSLILHPFLAKHRPWMKGENWNHGHYYNNHRDRFNPRHHRDADVDVETVEDSYIDVSVRMGSSVRYVNSEDFKQANIDVSMGNAKVYFQNVTVKESAMINVDVSLGGVELFVPKEWNVIEKLDDNDLSSVTEVGFRDKSEDSPKVTVQGYLSLSGMKINYI